MIIMTVINFQTLTLMLVTNRKIMNKIILADKTFY